jgi:hypothetical protein
VPNMDGNLVLRILCAFLAYQQQLYNQAWF